MTKHTDLYRVSSFDYDQSSDKLYVLIYQVSTPYSDEPHASIEESPIKFQIKLDFATNDALIMSIGDIFEANPTYVPSVLFEFSKRFEGVYTNSHHSCSPADAMPLLKEFTVSY